MKTIYLDNNATTKVADEVLEVMLPYFTQLYGNPSVCIPSAVRSARESVTREQVAALLGALPEKLSLPAAARGKRQCRHSLPLLTKAR